MRYFIFILSLFIFPLSTAQDLVEFENGQVADADDMNGNFSSLKDAIDSISIEAGANLLTAAGPPGADAGELGDVFIDTKAYEFYGPKIESGWGIGVSLIGPQGEAAEAQCSTSNTGGVVVVECSDGSRTTLNNSSGDTLVFSGENYIGRVMSEFGSLYLGSDIYVETSQGFLVHLDTGGDTARPTDSTTRYLFFTTPDCTGDAYLAKDFFRFPDTNYLLGMVTKIPEMSRAGFEVLWYVSFSTPIESITVSSRVENDGYCRPYEMTPSGPFFMALQNDVNVTGLPLTSYISDPERNAEIKFDSFQLRR